MLHIHLSDDERAELSRQLANRKISVEIHTRLRMVLLNDQGMSAPKIAEAVGRHENTVRKFLKRFQAGRFAALPDRVPPGRTRRIQEEHWQALEEMLDRSERTFTTRQMAQWMSDALDITVNHIYLAEVLKERGWRYKRTKRSLQHKQPDPDVLAAKQQQLAALKKSGPRGSH